jgi:hypothetical protein
MRFNALVRSINRFGLLCEGGYYDHDNTMVPVIEVVVVRNPTTVPNETDITNVDVGDEVGVEVLGRNFDLRDSRISAFGRTVVDVDTPAIFSEVDADAESDTQAGDEAAENDDPEESSDGGEYSSDDDADDIMKYEITGDVDTNALPGVDIEDEGFSLVEEENDDVPDIDSELEDDD